MQERRLVVVPSPVLLHRIYEAAALAFPASRHRLWLVVDIVVIVYPSTADALSEPRVSSFVSTISIISIIIIIIIINDIGDTFKKE